MADRTCSIQGCDKPPHARGWCKKHHTRWWRHGDPLYVKLIYGDDRARFEQYVDRSAGPDGCHPWIGQRNNHGYGKTWLDGKRCYAHRVAFLFEHGHWPEPVTRHRCDNPPCVNPAHLHEGTESDNQRDSVERGRKRNGDLRGEQLTQAKLTEEQVREIRRRYATGETQRSIAREYGVVQTTISRVVLRERWAHVE
jgi:hypothetical protein